MLLTLMYFAGVSTCCAKTSTAPLERLKILFQAQNIHYRDMGKTTIYLELTIASTAPPMDIQFPILWHCFTETAHF